MSERKTEGLPVDLFDFELPQRLIAQEPAAKRDQSRLLVVNRDSGEITHAVFGDLPRFLPSKVSFFRNRAAVLKARIRARRPTGGGVECLLLRPAAGDGQWWCLLKPGRKLPVGGAFGLEGEFTATVLEKGEDGQCRVAFQMENALEPVTELAERLGEMPLPPYIQRELEDRRKEMDAERYQTVYADAAKRVAAAAPTAGLHFTPQLLARLERDGHAWHDLILHVGLGTFRPIQAEDVTRHDIHTELYELPRECCAALLSEASRPRLAVGTTSLRAMEAFARENPGRAPTDFPGGHTAEASIFIYPPQRIESADILLTNFHLPRSTLLCLVSAFLSPGSVEGIKWLKDIYAEAIALDYRFFSYGDAMLIL